MSLCPGFGPRATSRVALQLCRWLHIDLGLLAHFKKPRRWPVKPPRQRLPVIEPGELGSPRLNEVSVLDRDISTHRASQVDFELTPEVQLAISIETEALRDHLWEEFRCRHNNTFNEELDGELQRELQDAYEAVRARWVRVQAALQGSDEALRAKAQEQLQQCIRGRSHFNPDLAQKLRELERWLPPEAADYLQELKQTGAPLDITEEDLAVLQQGPSEAAWEQRSVPAASNPKTAAGAHVTIDELLRTLQVEYDAMTKAGHLPKAHPEPMSEEELAHHRRVLQWEMEQDPHVVEMLEAVVGLSKERLLDEVMGRLGDDPIRPPP
eukprot:GGOE01043098.1.p1 GENE.GGOE01043098.1~~GGOE01043098.1.p1  ORF type:complete len:325 (+),score=97.15 GGOE01043098.1:55-1029(+)